MPITITTAGNVTVVPGETYIIDPSVNGTVIFVSDGSVAVADFTVQFDDSGSQGKIEIDNSGGDLSPTVNVADNVDIANMELDLGEAVGTDVNIGDNVSIDRIEMSENGANSFDAGDGNQFSGKIIGGDNVDTFSIGDNNQFLGEVKLMDGDDTMTLGEGNSFAENVRTGDGDDTVTGGDGNFFDRLQTGQDGDTVTLGKLDLSTGESMLIDGAEHNNQPSDTLTFDPTNGDVDALTTALEDSGYILQPDGKTWIAGPNADFHVKWNSAGNANDDDDDVNIFDWETIVLVCFAQGTRIATRQGSVPIESLKVGDEVITMDHGFQKIRWIGSSKVPARGHLAPVVIRKGAMGNEHDLRVSPQHRMLVRGWHVELLFGKSEALVPAKALINDETVFQLEGGEVEYFHMMFDRHELVYAEGIPSESFHPGHVGMGSFSEETREEILHIFPELREDVGAYSETVRPTLKVQEARMLAENSELLQER